MCVVLQAPRPLLQLTLAIVKPNAVAHPLILEAVHKIILSNEFLIVRSRDLAWNRQDSQQFYREHSGHFFYQRLVEFMASGPMRAYILAHEEAIPFWRSLMGPTKVFRAQHTDPDTIRGSYGLTDTRNSVHGSDSAASARREIATFFPDFCEEDWYRHEEPHLRCGPVCYDATAAIHRVPGDGWTEKD
ncbi:nucleoside diphosphate kinase 6 [Sphaerodactylus townsendi]|uniref:Nucleoside diphosphate kinase 6 n=1 Tax=Sphaerodactylus townsendi TaxID=933632 RepID=A0ACB8FL86_9SAUR|nr:nucleoside diphosphate kinase 6 [Sphaerodactylus townsendi]XP_048356781.1 nucleoside diphosphate kinase 6 [Sphaerodactylus townsendi]